jgi:hypothetical protein
VPSVHGPWASHSQVRPGVGSKTAHSCYEGAPQGLEPLSISSSRSQRSGVGALFLALMAIPGCIVAGRVQAPPVSGGGPPLADRLGAGATTVPHEAVGYERGLR